MTSEAVGSDKLPDSSVVSGGTPGISEQSTSERLVEVAGEIFAEKGRGATVREICSAAGCSVAAINYYFGDKNKLYLRCVQAACERKQKLFPLPDFAQLDNPPRLLRTFLRTIALRMTAKSNLSWQNTLMLREVISPSEGVADMLRSAFEKDFASLRHLLGALLGPELDSPANREQFATQVMARSMFLRTGRSLRGILQLDTQVNEDPETYADTICDSILLQIQSLKQDLAN